MVTKHRPEPTASKKRRGKPDLSTMPDRAFWDGLIALGKTVHLSLFVKVLAEWSRGERELIRLGYGGEGEGQV